MGDEISFALMVEALLRSHSGVCSRTEDVELAGVRLFMLELEDFMGPESLLFMVVILASLRDAPEKA
jgi:hypothetical protein